jgi:hypothetical protein
MICLYQKYWLCANRKSLPPFARTEIDHTCDYRTQCTHVERPISLRERRFDGYTDFPSHILLYGLMPNSLPQVRRHFKNKSLRYWSLTSTFVVPLSTTARQGPDYLNIHRDGNQSRLNWHSRKRPSCQGNLLVHNWHG